MTFLAKQRKQPVLSPALLEQITKASHQAVETFAQQHDTQVVHFVSGVRKDDLAAEQRKRFARTEGVVFIGVGARKSHGLQGAEEENRIPVREF